VVEIVVRGDDEASPSLSAARAEPFRSAGGDGFNRPKVNLAISRLSGLRLADMRADRLHPRFAESRLAEPLADSPIMRARAA
jgi:hypothetical protein